MKKKRILSFLLGMLLLTSVFLPTALAYAESAAAPSLPSPIASWDFENGNDPYTSSTSAAQKLVPGGSKLPLLDSSAVNGGSGGLRLFDRGSTLLTPNAPFDKSASYTCSMWVKIDDAQPAQGAPAYYSFFHLKDDKGWLSVIRENDATAYFRSNWGGFGMDTPTRVRTTNIAESIGAWHHVVLTYHHDAKNAANKRATLYIDGLEELYFTGKTAGPNNAKPFYLGSTKGGTEQVSMLDEISFYQTDLSAEQVALLYSEQKPVPSIEFVTSSDAMGKIYDGQPVSDPEIKTDSTGTVIFSYYTDDSGAPGTILSGGAPRNAGTYWVRARFAAADADAADSAQQMFTIQKAATLPGDVPSTPPLLTGRNGQPVSTVALPTGYNWTNGTELLREGTHAYHAAYSKDPVNYTGVPVQLDVTSAEYSDSGRYKNPELLIPNVIASETDPASGHTYPRNVNGSQTPRTAQYGIFDHTQWEFSEALSDEFNGTELNTDKWYPYYMDWWKATPGPAVEEGDVVIRDDGDVSRLVLHGTKNRELTFGGAPKHNTYRGFGIMGGAKDYLNYGPNTPGYPIVNHAPYHDALATTYGFFEVRTKFDIGNGSIPAIWFVGFQDEGGNAKSAEIDWPEMFNAEEYPGRDNKLSIWHLKNVNAGGSWERPTTDTPIAKYLDPNEDYRTDWHTIGVEWGENYVRYFFDGHLIGEYAAKIPYRMIPIISFNYRPYNNDGTLKDSTAGAKPEMQRDFEIDYYRVWKNKDVADPYEEPSLPESGNIASYAYISQFGLTSAQYDATPPELLNDGDYTKVALSGLQTKNLDGSDCGETHTKLPAYTFVDFRGPVDYNTVILYSTYAQSQAPTLVDIQINRASGRIDNGSVWETVAADVPLVWKTNTSQPESCVIRIPRTVAGNEHMRIVVKEANFNASGRFGISEIEIGTDLEAAQIAFPEYEEPIIPQKQTLPQAAAHWNFEGDTPLADSIAQKEISVYLHGSTAKPLPEFSAVNTLANGATGASYNGSTTASLFPLTGALNLKQDFTLSLWVKMDALPSELGHTCTLIQLPSGQGNHMFLSVDQSDTLQTYYGGNSAAGNTKLVADKWYNVIFSKNNSSISVYLNGQPELTSTKTAAYNASGLVIGNSRIGSENQGLSGQLDEVRRPSQILCKPPSRCRIEAPQWRFTL